MIKIFKRGRLNENIPSVKPMKHDVSTRFGTIFDMIEQRLLHYLANVICVNESADQDSAKSANDAYYSIKRFNSTFPSFEAIVTCFEPISQA